METLSALEAIETDNKDRPIEDLIIYRAQVFVDPFGEAEEQLTKERDDARQKVEDEAKKKEIKRKTDQPLQIFSKGIGKYINKAEISKQG